MSTSMRHAAHDFARVLRKWMNGYTPQARGHLAAMFGVPPSSVSAENANSYVRIEAAGSGIVLVPRLPLPEGTTGAQVKKEIATKFPDYPNGSFLLLLMQGHGVRVLKDEEVIPPGTNTLVLVRNIPSVIIDLNIFDSQYTETINFVVDGETFTVTLTKNQIEYFRYDIDENMRPVKFEIEHNGEIITEFGGYNLFVGVSTDDNRAKFTLFKYKFDNDIDIGNYSNNYINVNEEWIFQTKGTINGQEVTLTQVMMRSADRYGDCWEPKAYALSIKYADESISFKDFFLADGDCGRYDIVVDFLE